MNDLAEWIATHALPVWAALLMATLVVGDVAWQWNRRHGRKTAAAGGQPVAVRGVTAALLLLSMGLLFAAIAVALNEEATRWLPAFDQSLAKDLHASMQPGVLRLVAAVSHAGDLGSVAAASVLVLAVLLLRRHVRLATCWAVAMAGIVPINSGLKAMFQRPRPLDGYMVEHGWSFPSGHAFGAIVFYGMLAYVLLQRLPHRWHRWVIAAAVAMIGVIGLSRIVLQVHYFSDVMAGYASGMAWLAVCLGMAEWWRLRAPRR
ncbi:undecaprenyl-diphosphatase [Dyella jiangningensis]|uniref:phosphatase PAP2 family protein n=1 Tax=Dyella sp. AtDHG13 TaxID=1938897 RepID=UPI000880482E|nr:phosphatase PAP2 family protein [Dyella sp. AtDHG13]PXV61800.1 undecaprenyl-diphosphatase [Dyella sp. AtDHG13]SDJ63433.1 undecaprenyl-diphosphatase [Dyella jiangningensis]